MTDCDGKGGETTTLKISWLLLWRHSMFSAHLPLRRSRTIVLIGIKCITRAQGSTRQREDGFRSRRQPRWSACNRCGKLISVVGTNVLHYITLPTALAHKLPHQPQMMTFTPPVITAVLACNEQHCGGQQSIFLESSLNTRHKSPLPALVNMLPASLLLFK